ncbi:MAG TPA: Gfo/Idh/MocA family oxidoreductase [bacterium]|nr:Gfo/Idh/MocA family oxidoreductase [bacterium]
MPRRDLLKSMATLPVLGVFGAAFHQKRRLVHRKKNAIIGELGFDEAPTVLTSETLDGKGDVIRLGLIGAGGRGMHLIRSAGFADPEWTARAKMAAQEDRMNTWLKDYLNQPDLNVRLTAVCDVFDVRAEKAAAASVNPLSPVKNIDDFSEAKRHRHYRDLLNDRNVDAVIIATPDHWHAQMAMDAARAGKHVYLEKCMTRTEEEALALTRVIKETGITFQLGHQNRQLETYNRAHDIFRKGLLGPVTLVAITTNRNTPDGAWVYPIHPMGNPGTIDWDLFQGPAPNRVPFSRERFFRWRCWYDYGTGLSGDLLSHEYDCVNQVLHVGIPASVTASGGIYFFKDGRDVPDVFQATLEYPDRNLTVLYSATLANSEYRGAVFMGHDATMRVGGTLTVKADSHSTRYEKKIRNGLIDPSLPLFSFRPGSKGLDAVTSATEQYFSSRGLLYTYRDGKRVDSTHLHVKEWIDCIRSGGTPGCGIDRGFEEAITCHMATRAYLEKRSVAWDPVRRRIV